MSLRLLEREQQFGFKLDLPNRIVVSCWNSYNFSHLWRERFDKHSNIIILIYIQQDATLHSLFYLEIALHVSGGTSTNHQERKQLYLQHLVIVRPLLLPAAIAAGSSKGLTITRCCRYSCMHSWWWVEVPPETCRAISR